MTFETIFRKWCPAALGLALALQVGAPLIAGAQQADDAALPKILLTAGRSTVLATDFDITRIAVTDPTVADAIVVQPREVLIDGKSAGTISLIVWGATQRRQYDIVVDPGISTLQ